MAAAVAQELGEELPGGVIWVAADFHTSDDGLVGAVAEALGVGSAVTGQELRRVISRELGKRRTLLVLDGMDHPESLRDAATFLAAGPGLSVLATRTTPLGLASEQVLELRPLTAGQGALESPGVAFVRRLLLEMGDIDLDLAGNPDISDRIASAGGHPQRLEAVALGLLGSGGDQLIA